MNSFAIQDLAEVGIDIPGHRSKSVEEIDPSTVDTLITLCAEEEHPLSLGKAGGFIGACRIRLRPRAMTGKSSGISGKYGMKLAEKSVPHITAFFGFFVPSFLNNSFP